MCGDHFYSQYCVVGKSKYGAVHKRSQNFLRGEGLAKKAKKIRMSFIGKNSGVVY